MKKSIITLTVVAVVLAIGLFFVNSSWSKVKSFYSGDAVYHNGQVLVMTTNTGKLEIFAQEGVTLKSIYSIKPGTSGYGDFNTASFAQLNDRLYVFAASGNTIYKFDAENPSNLKLLASTTDNNWDWFGRLDRNQGKLVSIGSKGVKIWNDKLQVIDSYNVINTTNPYNVRLSADGRFIVNLNDSSLQIFDRQTRMVMRTIALDAKQKTGNRQVYIDDSADMIYVIDDAGIKRFGLNGNLYKNLKHDSRFGYDIVPNSDGSRIYVSNGTSIAKLNKSDFKFTAGYENFYDKTVNNWSMGLKVVNTPQGERVVAFNSGAIIVLNGDLKLMSRVIATEVAVEDEKALEPLALSTDRSSGLPYDKVTVSGKGYFANEKLLIKFGGRNITAYADAKGRFTKVIAVPAMKATRTDIKVTGEISRLSYSISFEIKQK